MAFMSLFLAGVSVIVVLTPGYELVGILVAFMSALMAQSANTAQLFKMVTELQADVVEMKKDKHESDTTPEV